MGDFSTPALPHGRTRGTLTGPTGTNILNLSAIQNAAYMSVAGTITETDTLPCGTTETTCQPVVYYYIWLPDLRGTSPSDAQQILNDAVDQKLYFMTNDVYVAPSGGTTNYAVDGCFFNHAFLYQCAANPLSPGVTPEALLPLHPVGTETTAPGVLHLNNASLYISDAADFTGLQGSNAALYVGGSLVLTGGNLTANEQGMVITADGITLNCGGTFNGFIASRADMVLAQPSPLPSDYTPLIINGGLMTDQGSLYLDATTSILYAPQYTKVLNQFADVEEELFQQVGH
jgi:hypothetical protein